MKQKHTAPFWRLVENENGHKNIIQNFVMKYQKNSYNIKKKKRKTQLFVIKKTLKKMCPGLHITQHSVANLHKVIY